MGAAYTPELRLAALGLLLGYFYDWLYLLDNATRSVAKPVNASVKYKRFIKQTGGFTKFVYTDITYCGTFSLSQYKTVVLSLLLLSSYARTSLLAQSD